MSKRLSLFPVLSALFLAGCLSTESPDSDTGGETRSVGPETLTILTEDYPPLSFLQDGMLTGQATEVVRALLAETGEDAVLRLVPWEEGLDAVLNDPATALFSTAMTPERKERLQWVGPIGALDTRLYARAGESLSIGSLADARQAGPIATVSGYYGEQVLASRGFTNTVSYPDEDAAIVSLLDGSSTLLVSNDTALPDLLARIDAGMDAVEPVFTLSINPTYLAFSPLVPEERVTRWQNALDRLKRDGRFEQIYNQWLSHGVAPGVLLMVTEDYPPLTYMEDGKVTGIVTEVLLEITERLGIAEPIRMTHWNNAYNLALLHPNVVLFSIERTEEREDRFHWVGPVGSNRAILYGRANTDYAVESLADARAVNTIATTTDWFTEQYLQEAGFTNLVSRPTPAASVQLLMDGAADLTILTDSTAPRIVAESGYHMHDLQPLLTVLETDYYIALSRGTPGAIVREWQTTLEGLKADGTIARIHERYSKAAPKQQPEAR